MKARLTAFGTYHPEKVMTNQEMEKLVETNDEWIQQRTGIKQRYFVEEDQLCSHLAIGAVDALAKTYDKDLSDVDFIIVASISPDQTMPSVASLLQGHYKIPMCGAIDITAACAGFVYTLQLAKGLVESGQYKKILIVGAEALSKITDFSDRTTCILFGDGAGAALIEASETSNISGAISQSFGEDGQNLYLSNNNKIVNGVEIDANDKIHQDGKKVYKWAVNTVSTNLSRLLESANLPLSEIDWFVPHSANIRIIEAICDRVGFDIAKTLESVSNCGNTSSASIPLAIQNGIDSGSLKKGDKLALFGFGGGLTYAGAVLTWDL